MRCTTCGNILIPGNRFCTSCGAANPEAAAAPIEALSGLAPPASAPTPGPSVPTPEAAPATAIAAAAATASPPAAEPGGRRRRFNPIPVAVIAVVVAVAVVAFVLVRRGGDGAGYSGPDRDLVVLTSYDGDGADESSLTRLGVEGRPLPLGDGGFESAVLIGTDRAVARSGGPVVGQVFEEDGPIVVSADLGDGEVVELLGESDGYTVTYDPDDDRVLVVEFSGSDERCHAGPTEGPLDRVGRGDRCFFSPDGRLVLTADDDDGEIDFEVASLDGTSVYEGSSARVPQFTGDAAHLVVVDGNDDRLGAVLVDLDEGLEVATAERGEDVDVLATDRTGRALVATQVDDEVVLEILEPGGTTIELLANEGPVQADFLDETSGVVVAVTTDENGAELRTLEPTSDGTDVVEESIATADELALYVASAGSRTGRFVAVETDDDDADAIIHVSTDSQVVQIDVDDFGGLRDAQVSADGARLFLSASISADETSAAIAVVDLRAGTFEFVLEDWYDVGIVDVRPDGESIVVVGYEEADDDEQIVAHVTVTGTVEFVEEADGFGNVSYTADGRGLIVSVIGSFDEPDEIDTFEYRLDTRSRPERLYPGQEVSVAGWDDLDAATQYVSADGLVAPLPTAGCADTLPGLEVVTPGDITSGFLDFDRSATYCLEVAESSPLTVRVFGLDGFDTTLEISGSNGLQVFNDDYDTLDPAIVDQFFDVGAYEVTVGGFEGSSGSYELVVES